MSTESLASWRPSLVPKRPWAGSYLTLATVTGPFLPSSRGFSWATSSSGSSASSSSLARPSLRSLAAWRASLAASSSAWRAASSAAFSSVAGLSSALARSAFSPSALASSPALSSALSASADLSSALSLSQATAPRPSAPETTRVERERSRRCMGGPYTARCASVMRIVSPRGPAEGPASAHAASGRAPARSPPDPRAQLGARGCARGS